MKMIVTLLIFSLFLCAGSASAQGLIADNTVKRYVALNAAAIGLSQNDLRNYRVAYAYRDEETGIILAYLQQTVNGTDVLNAIVSLAFKNDALVSSQSSWISSAPGEIGERPTTVKITGAQALQKAAAAINLPGGPAALKPLHVSADGKWFEFDKGRAALNNMLVRLNWFPSAGGRLVLCWQVSIMPQKENSSWQVQVNAETGMVEDKTDLARSTTIPQGFMPKPLNYKYSHGTNTQYGKGPAYPDPHATYRVIKYPDASPNTSLTDLAVDPWNLTTNKKAITLKWNFDRAGAYINGLKGNNTEAYEDLDGNNLPGYSPRSQRSLPNLLWNYIPDSTKDPITDSATMAFGITNLFYWTNLMHDMSYSYGFNEVAGNAQTDNLSRGGQEDDRVLAETLDSHLFNTASFAPAVDGQVSRMQMNAWYPSPYKLLTFNSPPDIAGPMIAAESNLSTENKLSAVGGKTGEVAYYLDADLINHRACATGASGNDLTGKIAFINRGGCAFTVKIKNAQLAGAIGVIVADSVVGSSALVTMFGSDNTITIPAVFISYNDGQRVRADLDNHIVVNATLNKTANLDGALDNTISTREYTHLISNRLTGGPQTISCLNNGEEPGEGWSDYFALMMTTKWYNITQADSAHIKAIGNYALGYSEGYAGLRAYPYSTDMQINPWNYDSLRYSVWVPEITILDRSGTLYTGELFCSTLWDMTWALVEARGLNKTFLDASKTGGNSIAMRLVMEGMKLQKCSPGVLDARDAILKADTVLYGAIHSPIIWKVFARRGMGYSALQGSNKLIKDGTAAYNLPPGSAAISVNSAQQDIAFKTNTIKLKVSPNPASGDVLLTIPGNMEKLSIRIINAAGTVVYTGTTSRSSVQLTTRLLPAGIYSISVTGNSFFVSEKLIKQ